MAGQRIAGTAFLKADGAQYLLAGSLTVSIDNLERDGKAGLSGVAGYGEAPRVPFIEGEVFLTADLSTATLLAMTNVTVTAELANGRTYVLSNAWTAKARELNAADGTTTVRFEGMRGREI